MKTYPTADLDGYSAPTCPRCGSPVRVNVRDHSKLTGPEYSPGWHMCLNPSCGARFLTDENGAPQLG